MPEFAPVISQTISVFVVMSQSALAPKHHKLFSVYPGRTWRASIICGDNIEWRELNLELDS